MLKQIQVQHQLKMKTRNNLPQLQVQGTVKLFQSSKISNLRQMPPLKALRSSCRTKKTKKKKSWSKHQHLWLTRSRNHQELQSLKVRITARLDLKRQIQNHRSRLLKVNPRLLKIHSRFKSKKQCRLKNRPPLSEDGTTWWSPCSVQVQYRQLLFQLQRIRINLRTKLSKKVKLTSRRRGKEKAKIIKAKLTWKISKSISKSTLLLLKLSRKQRRSSKVLLQYLKFTI